MGRNAVCPAPGSPEEINDFYIPTHRAPLIARLGWKEAPRGAPASLPFGVCRPSRAAFHAPALSAAPRHGARFRNARGQAASSAGTRGVPAGEGAGAPAACTGTLRRQGCSRPTLEGSVCAISGRIYNRQSASHKIKAS